MNNIPKLIELKEFVEKGYLQEMNRRFLHPLGLAMAFQTTPDGESFFYGIFDVRQDPEGFVYNFQNMGEKELEEVRKKQVHINIEWSERLPHRKTILGSIVEDIP